MRAFEAPGDHLAAEILGQQKKLLEFMRTMMVEPDIVLLDEPFWHNPALTEQPTESLDGPRRVTFLLISHEMSR